MIKNEKILTFNSQRYVVIVAESTPMSKAWSRRKSLQTHTYKPSTVITEFVTLPNCKKTIPITFFLSRTAIPGKASVKFYVKPSLYM